MVGVTRKHNNNNNNNSNNNSNILLFATFLWFQYSFCYRYHIRFIVFPKIRKTILTQQYFARCRYVGVNRKNNNNSNILLFATFSDSSIIFVTVNNYGSSYLPQFAKLYCRSNTSQDVAMLVWTERTTIIVIYCCLLVFSDCSIIFVTVIIYGSSPSGIQLYLPKFTKLYCYGKYFAQCQHGWCDQKEQQ
jgi:hypothetical protein